MQIPQEKDVVDKLMAWGTAHPLIRAMILTSSRTRPDGPVDPLSDYDLILAVSDVGAFAADCAWISDYGRPSCVGAIRASCMVWPHFFWVWSIRSMSRSITAFAL